MPPRTSLQPVPEAAAKAPTNAAPSALAPVLKRSKAEIIATHERSKAEMFLAPSMATAIASVGYLKTFGTVEFSALVQGLEASMAEVHKGETKNVESMLIGQAHALQTIFAHLAHRAVSVTGLRQYEMDLRLALRAQAQCCRTLEVLAAIKNPPVVLARQANITTGPQQINNGQASESSVSRGRTQVEPNELLQEAP